MGNIFQSLSLEADDPGGSGMQWNHRSPRVLGLPFGGRTGTTDTKNQRYPQNQTDSRTSPNNFDGRSSRTLCGRNPAMICQHTLLKAGRGDSDPPDWVQLFSRGDSREVISDDLTESHCSRLPLWIHEEGHRTDANRS